MSTELTQEFHNPKSLLWTCIRYVASNLDLVQSFVQFPEQIGQEIFSSADALGGIQRPVHLKLFCEAYGALVLTSLNLRKCYLVLNNRLDSFLQFTSLSHLDVGSCGLGDDHPLLSFVSSLPGLVVLGLSDDALTDNGIRKMTSPMRMFDKGPLSLHYLDLTDNRQISESGVRYLKVFKHLEVVMLTRTSVKVAALKHVKESMGLVDAYELPSPLLFEVVTSGWAAEVVGKWIVQSQKSLHTVKKKKSSFYSRHKTDEYTKTNIISTPSKDASVLVLVKMQLAHEEVCDDRRITQTFKCDKLVKKFHSKRGRDEINLETEDDDQFLLNMYSGTTYNGEKASKKSRLQDVFL